LGIESPRVTNTTEVVEGEGEVLLLQSGGSLKQELKSSLKNKDSRVWILEREELKIRS
jgi:hypothetical protein